MPNPDYFSNFSPKSFSFDDLEKEDEKKEKDLFDKKNLRKDICLENFE
jgi:hypothetical protein